VTGREKPEKGLTIFETRKKKGRRTLIVFNANVSKEPTHRGLEIR